MSARRKDKELFELLRETLSEQQKKLQDKPTPPQVETSGKDAPSGVTSHPPADETTPPSTVCLRQETCVLAVAAVLLLVAAAFATGYLLGHYSKNTAVPLVAASAGKKGELPVPEVSPPPRTPKPQPASHKDRGRKKTSTSLPSKGKTLYTLRVWTGSRKAVESAREVVSFLKGRGFDAWARRTRKGITVSVGQFRSPTSKEARRIRERVKKLIYKGRRAFNDCYFVKMEG